MNIDAILQRLGATIGAQQVEIEILKQQLLEVREKEASNANNGDKPEHDAR